MAAFNPDIQPRLAIIGGGQAAKAVLFAVAERAAAGRLDWRGVEIVVYERDGEFATGLAWSRRFALEEHVPSLPSPQARVVYGDGQRRQFAECVALLRDLGVQVRLAPFTDVVGLERAGAGWRLQPAEGPPQRADAVVLATGHWHRCDPVLPGALRPWPARALQDAVLAGTGRVLVIGAGLTSVDAAVTLAVGAGRFDAGADGRFIFRPRRPLAVTLASRSGCMPSVWGAPPPPLPDLEAAVSARLEALSAEHGRLPLESALDVVAATACDAAVVTCGPVAALGIPIAHRIALIRAAEEHRAADPLARLEADLAAVAPLDGPIASARLRGSPAQALLLALLPIVSERFHGLDADDHALFQARLRGPLFRRAMPMGLDSALRVSALAGAGRLRVRRLDPADPPRQAADGTWSVPAFAGAPAQVFDHVVDGTGQTADLATRAEQLWTRLLRDRLVRPALRRRRDGTTAPTGGVDVDVETRRVRAAGAAPPLYAMGALTLGLFVDAQGIGHLMRDAARIIADLDAQGFSAGAAVASKAFVERSMP
ncbi:hypothetical protein GOD00_23390 [Sinorhizobium medicae]|nr:hypothetical protein [Sinorhizobium medicae]